MKKLIVVALTLALVIGVFGSTMTAVSAESGIKFISDIAPGAHPDDPLVKGEIKVFNNGTYEIKVWGCNPDQKYQVALAKYVGSPTMIQWYNNSPTDKWARGLGSFTTDEGGKAKFTGTLPAGEWSLFAFNDWNESPPNEFVSGFQIP